jgi:glycosyltransferase involved in cell wall biosynthesis
MYPLSQIPGLLAEADVGLVPLEISSITDYVLPLKLLEYLCLGMPSVTVRNAAIGYYFGEDDCLFYDPKNPESLQLILDRLVADPAWLAHYRQRALALRDQFLWSNEKEKYATMLRRLAQQAPELSTDASQRARGL